MNAAATTLSHARIALLDLFRSPGYVVPTVVFPAMFFALFDLSYARTQAIAADYATLGFTVFAITGISFYQFGVGIAQERGRPWERYLRTLPVTIAQRLAARVLSAMVFAFAAAGLLALLARFTTPIDLSAMQWILVAAYAVAGGVPFVLMGIALGYWAGPRSAMPIATAANLLLAYAGGLWIPPQFLPQAVQAISPYLPTRMFAELLWSVPSGATPWRDLGGLAIYGIVFAALAARGYRRDERTRYA